MRFKHGLVGRLATVSSSLALATAAASCAQQPREQERRIETPPVAVTSQALADTCFQCEANGIAEGNAAISGVASVDAFFGSVISFQAKADNVSVAINAELNAIKGDFGIDADTELAAGLQASIMANVEGSLNVEAEPARCAADVSATLEAQARCDAEFEPGSATVMCEGSCEVEASAMVDCGASAELKCTVNPPMGMCDGTCKGTCTANVMAAAACSGTCRGSCTGTCSAYAKNAMGNAECAGSCDGMCQGSCEVELAAEAECSGECRGECTFTPPNGNCEGGIRAKCEAMAGAMVECEGRCEGTFEPPTAKAECQASAKAEAKINVECTPPRLAINYELRAGANAEAQAQFEAGIKSLQVRLPALLAAIARADVIVDAGEGLAADATGAVRGGIMAATMGSGAANVAAVAGLTCALGQLGDVGAAIGGASGRLEASLSAAAELTTVLGV